MQKCLLELRNFVSVFFTNESLDRTVDYIRYKIVGHKFDKPFVWANLWPATFEPRTGCRYLRIISTQKIRLPLKQRQAKKRICFNFSQSNKFIWSPL